ncbi:MAG: hypothetical protein M3018_08940 [Actinomycetota bacterium]|nr:hypothetical protein [Actinomycetota bacterium]
MDELRLPRGVMIYGARVTSCRPPGRRAQAGAAALALMLALALSACGSNPRDGVKAKVMELGQAAAAHDYRRICDDVLAPSLIARLRAYGISCERAMRIALAGVRNPAISIGAVTVKGSTASAIALSMAAGQRASLETIELIMTPRGWRVASLRAL